MSEYITVERLGAVLHLRINRPQKKNALTVEMYSALDSELRGAEHDPEVRAVLFSGEGDAFTAGNDLADFLERPPTEESSPTLRFLDGLVHAGKPLVAAVHGLAVGIGTTLLLHCDLVYAAPGTRFSVPFVPLGLVPEAGSGLLLPQLMGHARAAEMLLLGEPIDAEEAHRVGIVSRIVPADELLEHAKSRATRLADLPPEAIRLTKQLMRRGNAAQLDEQMREELHHFGDRLRSEEARAAFQAFFDARAPASKPSPT